MSVEAFPLVGLGGAYEDAGVATVGPRRALPSGGLTLHHHRLLLADLLAGLVPLTFAQLRFLRRARPLAVLVVGDAYAQAQAQLVRAPRRVLQPLVSVHQSFDLDGRPVARTALHRSFMERVRAPELWLMQRADRVYARDVDTAVMLRSRGVEHVVSLGNPVMDELDAEPLLGPTPGRAVVALLPGSRQYAERSLLVMVEALRVAGRAVAQTRVTATAGSPPLPRTGARAPSDVAALLGDAAPGSLLGLVAWTRGAVPAAPEGWKSSRSRVAGVAGVEAVWRLADESGAPVEVWFASGRFAAVLASASVVIGTAGTANEQAAGLGLPVVSFAVPPDYGEAFLANQERLLGGAVRVVAGDPAAVAAAVLEALPGSEHSELAARMGPLRMAAPGGTAALVSDLADWLQRLRRAEL